MQFKIDSEQFFEGIFDSRFKFPGYTVTKPRRVEYFELEIYTEVGGVAHIGEEERAIRPGLFICAHPGDIRYSDLPTKCHYVKLLPELVELTEALKAFQRFSKLRSPEYCTALIQEMMTAAIAGDPLTRIARLLELIAILKKESLQYRQLHSIEQKRPRSAVELALDYLEQHYTEKCSLETLAEHVHFSPIHFHKIFQKAVGKTPNEYLTMLRINEAKRLLLTQDADMLTIAESCGFSSQAYFNAVFKREIGLAPKAYRMQSIKKYSF